MNKQNNYTHYRYKTILSQSISKSHKQSHGSCNLKDVAAPHTTRYQNLRIVQKNEELKKSSTQRKMQAPSAKKIQRYKTQLRRDKQQLIGVGRVKLHKNITNLRFNQQYTMNRHQFKQFIKTKKPTEFSMTKSVEEIQKKYPKKIDVFINQLKLKVAAIEDQYKINTSHHSQKQYGPLTVLKNQRIAVRQLLQPKNIQKAQMSKTYQRPRILMTEYQLQDVSGWQIEAAKQYSNSNLESSKFKEII